MQGITYSPDIMAENKSNTSIEDMIPDDMEDAGQYPSHYYDSVRYAKFYTLGVIIPLGLVFNSVASMIFLRKRMRNIGTAHYFVGLACADNIVLFGEFLLWTSSFDSKGIIMGLDFIHQNTSVCRLVHFLRYMGRLWSSWLVVVICLDRYITIALPHVNLPSPCLDILNKPIVVVASLALISTALSCPAFFAVGVFPYNGTNRCLILSAFDQTYHKWRQAVMILGELFLPSIIVAIFTALIIIRLTRARQRFPGQQSVTASGEERAARRRNRDAQLTMALLSVATSFVILRLPYIICYEINLNKENMSREMKYATYAAYSVSYLFAVANYAVNFFLYVISGVRFRMELLNMLRCKPENCGNHMSVTTQQATIGRTSIRDIPNNQVDQEALPMKELKKPENLTVNNAAKYVSLPQTANNDTSQHV